MLRTLVVVVVTLCIQGGPFSYEADIQRGPVTLHPALRKKDLNADRKAVTNGSIY